MKAKQVLQIEYNQQQGLILGWRYTDLSPYLTFFRHLIVFFTDDKQNAIAFHKTYLKRMRPGDLYSLLYFNHEGKLRMKGWREKIHAEQTQEINHIIKGPIMIANREDIMLKLEEQFQLFSEPIVVTIYLDNLKQRNWLETRILQQRSESKYDFIVGIFGPFATASLTFGNDVNIIPFRADLGPQTVNFYLTHVYQSAVLWACATIQCLNAQISSSNSKSWRNIGFNMVERIYRGPSIKYDKDFLHFYANKSKEAKYNLTIKLTYVTLDRHKFFSEKQFSVQYGGGFNKLTFSITHWNKPYHAYGDIWLQDNPFRSLTILKFDGQNSDHT